MFDTSVSIVHILISSGYFNVLLILVLQYCTVQY